MDFLEHLGTSLKQTYGWLGFNKHPSSLLMFRILKLQIAVETSIHPQLLSFYKLTAWTDIPSGQRIIILNSETRVIQGPYKGHTRVIGLPDYHRRALSKTKSLKNGLFNGWILMMMVFYVRRCFRIIGLAKKLMWLLVWDSASSWMRGAWWPMNS